MSPALDLTTLYPLLTPGLQVFTSVTSETCQTFTITSSRKGSSLSVGGVNSVTPLTGRVTSSRGYYGNRTVDSRKQEYALVDPAQDPRACKPQGGFARVICFARRIRSRLVHRGASKTRRGGSALCSVARISIGPMEIGGSVDGFELGSCQNRRCRMIDPDVGW